MGSTSQTGREREMYLIVLLLISTALGRPNSAQLDVGENIVNQLNSIVHFTNDTGSLLGDSRLIRLVSEGLQAAAELNILEMEAGLQSYVAAFNYSASLKEAKSYLQQTRQDLRYLADTAVKEVRDVTILLEDLDRNNDPDLLKIAIDIIEDMMVETKERLEASREKYQSVRQAFGNLISTVTTQNEILDRVVGQLVEHYLRLRNEHFQKSVRIRVENFCEELADFKPKSERFLERTRILNQDIDVAIDLISDNLDQINTWADSAEDVSENIEDYPAEYLEKYESNREAFKTGLVDLKNVAEQFLVDRITTSSRLLGTDDEDLRFAEQNMLKMSMELNGASSYFERVNVATSNLRQTRQELRELANRTVTEGRNLALLLDALPGSGTLDTLLTVFLDTMKDLMIETEEKLEEAIAKHRSAPLTFYDLKFSVLYELQRSDTDRLFERTTILNRDLDDAEVVIDEADHLIGIWRQYAITVNDNIDQYPLNLLTFKSIRTIFKSQLVYLKDSAENYLDQTK